jgi:hypothetical protein
MRRRDALAGLAGVLMTPAIATPAAAQPGLDPLGTLDRLLASYLRLGVDGIARVSYGAWKAAPGDRAALNGVIAALAAQPVSRLPRADQFALWANLYNSLTLSEVLGAYPIASIRDIKSRGVFDFAALVGPWKTKLVTVEGRALSLDDIEHAIMRPTFKDPRVHYAVNCASIGCPNLNAAAFRGATLEAQLDASARAFINHPRAVQAVAGGLRLSSIYDWFKVDFGAPPALKAHLQRYAAPDLARAIAGASGIAGYVYDWSLNDLRGRR